MKLRIRDNSVRLRLTRSEVDAMRTNGHVAAATSFPGGARFEYALQSSDQAEVLSAEFAGGRLLVRDGAASKIAWFA